MGLLTRRKPLWLKHWNKGHLASIEHELALVPKIDGDFACGIGLYLPEPPFRVFRVFHVHARRKDCIEVSHLNWPNSEDITWL